MSKIYLLLQQWWSKTFDEFVHPIPHWFGAPDSIDPPDGWVKQWVTDSKHRQFILYRQYDPEDGKWKMDLRY